MPVHEEEITPLAETDLERRLRLVGEEGMTFATEAANEIARLRKELAGAHIEVATLVRAINELREQLQTIGDISAAFRRMPIRDLSEANIRRNS